jgi:hypothetical protein
LNVDDYIRIKDPKEEDEADPPEIDDLKRDVEFHRKQAQKLRNEIPEHVIVSIFKVDCRDFRDLLSGKHDKIAELEVEIIAKRARLETFEMLK